MSLADQTIMESEGTVSCQWNHCKRKAAKHVVFGTRVFDAPGNVHISDSSQPVKHLDLCVKHAELISLQYVHVHEYELGACPHPKFDIDPR